MKKILVTFAVEDEVIPININGYETRHVITGIGKTRAAMKLTKAICDERPDMVLNVGTSGTISHAIGDIFVCKHFIDRDFQAIKLLGIDSDIAFAATPFDELLPATKTFGVCNTGDGFVTEAVPFDGDVVDMEAFALAVVCREFQLPFVAVKYVTDIVGQNSIKHWEDKLSDAREGLQTWFDCMNRFSICVVS